MPTMMPERFFDRPCVFGLCIGFVLAILPVAMVDAATVRLKDITDFEGVRDNQLIGYGLVVGLDGTGDSLKNSAFTEESLVAMLERLGVSTRGTRLRTENVAAVMVTATLPPFARQGSRIDVAASALGDAESLMGGTLLVTPLLGADSEVYAVAQGPLAIGGFSAEGDAESIVKGVPTAARIASGAIVEREIPFDLNRLKRVRVNLRNPDFTTAQRIAAAINQAIGVARADATDPSTVTMPVPDAYAGRIAALMTEIEQLRIEPDQTARVLIDERSGIIVIGKDVRISTVAVAQGNLTVRVTETPEVSQPNPFGRGQTEVVDRTQIDVDEQDGNRLVVLDEGVTLDELVRGLNTLGVGPRDLISIIQAIKASGALQAEIEVM